MRADVIDLHEPLGTRDIKYMLLSSESLTS